MPCDALFTCVLELWTVFYYIMGITIEYDAWHLCNMDYKYAL